MTRPTPDEVTLAESVINAAGGRPLSVAETLRIREHALDAAVELAMERIKSNNYVDKATCADAVVRAAAKFEAFLQGTPNTTEESSDE